MPFGNFLCFLEMLTENQTAIICHVMFRASTVKCHYSSVECDIIRNIPYNVIFNRVILLQWLRQSIDESLNQQNASHISPYRASYGMCLVRILKKMDCVITALLCISSSRFYFSPYETTSWHSRPWWLLVHSGACGIISAKTSAEPMPSYHQREAQIHIGIKLHLLWQKCQSNEIQIFLIKMFYTGLNYRGEVFLSIRGVKSLTNC